MMARSSPPHVRTEARPSPPRAIGRVLLLGLLLLGACRPPAACLEAEGCVLVPPDAPLVIGVLRAWLGEYAQAGEQMLDGIQQAVEERPTLLGHEILLRRAGSECSEESARIAATALLTDSDIFLILGPTCPDEIPAITPLLQDAGVILVTPPPGKEAAYHRTRQVLDSLEQIAVKSRDGTLYLPRRAVQASLTRLP